MQVQLQRGEKTEKDDESPVTVADYGAQVRRAGSLGAVCCLCATPWAAFQLHDGRRFAAACAATIATLSAHPHPSPMLQALVAWSLQRSFPGQAVSLVAEEDAVELRMPEGADMLACITALVNEALAIEHPEVGVGGVGGCCADPRH